MSRPIDQRIIRLTLDNSDVVKNGKSTKGMFASILDSVKNFASGGMAGLRNVADAVVDANREFGILEKIATGALHKVGAGIIGFGKNIVSNLIAPIRQGWDEFDGLLGQQQQIMVNSGRSIQELTKLMDTLQSHANRSTASFYEMVKMTNALAASPWVNWYDLDSFIIGFQTLGYLMASGTDKVRAMNNQFIPMMNGLKAGQEATQAQLAELYNWGLLGVPLLREMTNELVNMGYITEDTAAEIHNLGAVGGILELQERLGDTALLAEVMRDGFIAVGEEFSHLATTPISFQRLLDQIANIQLAGWKRSFELILGNVVQAREVFGMLAELIIPIVGGMHDWRNYALEIWQNMGGRQHLFGDFAYETQRITQNMSVWNPYFERMITHAAAATKEFGEGVKYIDAMSEELGVMVRHFPDGTKEFTKWSDVAGSMVTYTTSLYHNLRLGSKYAQRSAEHLYDLGEITSRVADNTDAVYKLMPRVGAHGESLGYSMQRVEEGLEGSTIYSGYLARDMTIWNDELGKYETILAGTHVSMATLSDYFSELTGISEYTRTSFGAVGNIVKFVTTLLNTFGNVIGAIFGQYGQGLAGIIFILTSAFYGLSQILLITVPIFNVLGSVIALPLRLISETIMFLVGLLPSFGLSLQGVYNIMARWADSITGFLNAISLQGIFNILNHYLRNLGELWERTTGLMGSAFNLFTGMLRNSEGDLNIWGRAVDGIGLALQEFLVNLANHFGFTEFAANLMDMTSGLQILRETFSAVVDHLISSSRRLVIDGLATIAEFFGFLDFAEYLRSMGGAWDAMSATIGAVLRRIGGYGNTLLGIFTALLAGVGALFGAAGFGLVYGFRWLVDWFSNLGTAVDASGVSVSSFGNVFSALGNGIVEITTRMIRGLNDFFGTVREFLSMGGLAQIISLIYGLAFMNIGSGIKKLPGILDKLVGAFNNLANKESWFDKISKPFKDIRSEFTKSVESITEGINTLSQGTKFSPPILLQVAAALVALAGSVFLIAQLDPTQVAVSMGALAGGMAAIYGMVMLFKKNPVDGIKMKAVGASLIMVSTAIAMVAGSVAILGTMDFKNMAQGISGVIVLFAAFMAINKFIQQPDMGELTFKQTILRIGLMKATIAPVKKLAIVSGALGLLPLGAAIQGVTSVTVLMGAMLGFSLAMSKIGPPDPLAIKTIKGMTASLTALTLLVAVLGTLSLGTVVQGTLTVGALTVLQAGMVGMMGSINMVAPPKAALATLTVMTAVMAAWVPMVIILGTLPKNIITQGVIAVGAMNLLMIGLMAMMSSISTFGDGGGMIKAAAAITILVAAMVLLIPVIVTLGTLPWEVVAVGMGFLAAQLGLLIAAGFLANKAAPGLLALAAAVLAKGVSFNLGALAVTALAVALPALAIAVVAAATTLLAAGAILEQFIVLVGRLLVTFVRTTIQTLAEMGYEIGFALGRIVVGIGEGLIQSIDQITTMLTTMIFTVFFALVNALDENMRSLVQAIGGLILNMFDEVAIFVWANAPRIAAAAGLLVGALIEAILQAVVNMIRKLPIPFSNQIADMIEDNVMDGIRDANMDGAERLLAARCEQMARMGFIEGVESGIYGATPSLIAASQVAVDEMGRPFYQLNGAEHGSLFIEDIASSAGVASGLLTAVAQDGADAMEAPFSGLDGFNLGDMFGGGIISGLDIEQFGMAGFDISDMLGSPIEDLDGMMLGEGFTMEVVDGVASVRGHVTEISGDMARSIVAEFEAQDYFTTGSGAVIEFGEGMSAYEQGLFELGRQLGETGLRGLQDPEFAIAADYAMIDYVGGLDAHQQRILEAGMRIADYAYDGLDSVNTFILGQELGYGYAQGLNCVGGSSRYVDLATRKQADLVAHNLRDVEGMNIGVEVMGNYVAGIISESGSTDRAVRTIINGQEAILRGAEFTGEGADAMVRFANGVEAEQSMVNRMMSGVSEGNLGYLQTFLERYGDHGRETLVNVAAGMDISRDDVVAAIRYMNDEALAEAAGRIPEYEGIGYAIAEGTDVGVRSGIGRFLGAIGDFFRAGDLETTNILDVSNPSMKYARYGEAIANGTARGVDNGTEGFLNRIRNMFTRGRDEGTSISYESAGRAAVDTTTDGATGRESVFRTGINNVMTNVRTFANGFNSSSIGRNYVDGISDASTGREGTFRTAINNVLTNVRTNANRFNPRSIGTNYMNEIASASSARESHFRNNINNVLTNVRNGMNNFNSRIVGTNYMNEVTAGSTGREGHFRSGINSVLTNVRNNLNNFNSRAVGTGYVNNIRTGSEGREGHLRTGVNNIMTRVRTAAGNISFNGVGNAAMRGVEAGAQGRAGTSNNVFANLGRGLLNSMRRVLGINSPSTEFSDIVKYCMQGFVLGIKRYDKTYMMVDKIKAIMDDVDSSGMGAAAEKLTGEILSPFMSLSKQIRIILTETFGAGFSNIDTDRMGLDAMLLSRSLSNPFVNLSKQIQVTLRRTFGVGFSQIDTRKMVFEAERLTDAILAPFIRLSNSIQDIMEETFGDGLNDVVLNPVLKLRPDAGGGYDPRGDHYTTEYNSYEFGDTHINITVPDGQSAEETMAQFETKFNKCLTKTIRDFRVVR